MTAAHTSHTPEVSAVMAITPTDTMIERIWDKPVDYRSQKSIDKVLEYFIRNGRLLSIEAEGDVMSVVTKIITDMKAQTPSHLADDVDNMMNYLIAWLCDYCEEANAHYLDINFTLKKKIGNIA